LAVGDGRLECRSSRRALLWVSLDDVVEIVLRPAGGWLFAGMDRGVGLVLASPVYYGWLGNAHRIMPRLYYLMSGAHLVLSDVYEGELGTVAVAIAAAARQRTGREVPISILEPGKPKRPLDSSRESGGSDPVRPAVAGVGVVCIGCGYDLRTTDITRVCPECGTPVAYSLDDGVLSRAGPDWLARVRVGALVCAVSQALVIVGIFAVGRALLEFVLRGSLGFAAMLGAACAATVLGAGTIGVLLFTVRPRWLAPGARDLRCRRLSRWAQGAVALVAILFLALPKSPVDPIQIALVALLLLTWGSMAWYAGELAVRVGARRLFQMARLLALVHFTCLMAVILGLAVDVLRTAPAAAPPAQVPPDRDLRTFVIFAASFGALPVVGDVWLFIGIRRSLAAHRVRTP